MNASDWVVVAIVVLLFLASVWLAVAETAFIRMNRVRALALADEGHRSAAKLERMLQRPEATVNGILLLVLVRQISSAYLLGIILDRLPASLWLASVAFALSVALGLPLGVAAAVRTGTWVDMGVRLVALVGQAVPLFWLGIVLMFVFGVQLGWLPTSGYGSVRHFVLPATTMALFTLAAVARLTRISMLEALDSEYVRLARIKGLAEGKVIFKHALANSLVPVLTYMGAFFATMITGAVVIETVFGWPGIGRLAYEAILARDYPVMQGVVLATTALFMVANMLVDVAHAWIDPRVRR